MTDVDDDDDRDEAEEDTVAGWLVMADALSRTGFTLQQMRALAQAGCVKKKMVGKQTYYSAADLDRLVGVGAEEAPEKQEGESKLVAEFKALAAGYQAMMQLALRQTQQAQEHERLLITAFSKPLENIGDTSRGLVGAVLDQNKQLVERANAGDVARLDFVKAAETMLRDQRVELREQAELDRKHALKQEVWEGVKKAAPHLLEGLRETVGGERVEAAQKLKEKLSPDKVAALIAFGLIDSEELDLLCKVFGYDRADLEARAREAQSVKDETEPKSEPKPEATE